MKITSLGRQTDLIFANFSGSVQDCGNYILVKTPNNPGYHWGNYIIFDRAPTKGDLKEWKDLFDKEFTYYKEPHHYVFTWDNASDEKGEYQVFLEDGFEFDSGVVLVSDKLNPPVYPNSSIEIKKIQSDHEWLDVIKLQILCEDSKYVNEYYENFKKEQMGSYRKMAEAGLGNWFGAYIGNFLVGNLGIFYVGEVARYQSVGTYPEYRRQGICGTLVCVTGQIAQCEYGVKHIVMEADMDYHAARIYESVGFKRLEINHALSWWRGY